MTSVVQVSVTPDLKICKAYISVLADEEQAKDTIRGLKSAEGEEMTQKEVANLLGISQSYISRLEKKIMRQLKKEISLHI